MGSSIATVITGTLTADPELRYLKSGVAVCDLRFAVEVRVGSGDQATDETQWVRASAWRLDAENAGKMLRKGSIVQVISDDLHMRQYTTNAGQAGVSLECTVRSIKYISNFGAGAQGNTSGAPAANGAPPAADGTNPDIPF